MLLYSSCSTVMYIYFFIKLPISIIRDEQIFTWILDIKVYNYFFCLETSVLISKKIEFREFILPNIF